jgi:hypothetical protein
MFDSGRQLFAPMKRNRLPSSRGNSERICRTRALSGTRCSLPAFMRFAGTGPNLLGEVDFVPRRVDDFVGAGGGEDGEFKRAGADEVLATKLFHERRRIGMGQRRVVLAALKLLECRCLRQKLVEVAAPRERIGAGPVFVRCRPTKNQFAALPDP